MKLNDSRRSLNNSVGPKSNKMINTGKKMSHQNLRSEQEKQYFDKDNSIRNASKSAGNAPKKGISTNNYMSKRN